MKNDKNIKNAFIFVLQITVRQDRRYFWEAIPRNSGTQPAMIGITPGSAYRN